MSAAIGLVAACGGAVVRLRAACRELDPRVLPWVSTAGDDLAHRLELERSVIRRAADELEQVRQLLGRAGAPG